MRLISSAVVLFTFSTACVTHTNTMQRHSLLSLAQLLCVGLLASTHLAAAEAPTSPITVTRSIKPDASKYGITPSRDFISDMCRLVTDSVQMVPWPLRIDSLCDNLGLSDPANDAAICPMFDLMKMLLGSLQSMYPLQCSPDGIAQPSSADSSGKGILLPSPLPSQMRDGRLPTRFPDEDASSLLEAEGPTHYWLYKNTMRLMAWAPCNAMGVEGDWKHPEGWELLALLSAEEDLSGYNIAQTSMPFAAVLRRAASAQTRASCKASLQAHPVSTGGRRLSARAARELCWGDELVVLVRGTTTAYDWWYNLDYGMARNKAYGPGAMHLGFLKLSDKLWAGGLRKVLDQYGSSASSITIAGHSLGAASAALLSARTQKYLASKTSRAAASPMPQVTAVLFGSPNVGDATFSADYNTRVNTRNIGFFTDMVTEIPCVGSMVQCSTADEKSEASGTVSDAAAGSRGGNVTVKFLSYDRLGGRIELQPGTSAGSRRVLPAQSEAWSLLSVYTQDDFCNNMMSMGNLVEATHVCSYMCALSNTSPDSAGDWCLLWPEEGSAAEKSGATYCMSGYSFISEQDFPTSPTFPSRKDSQWLQQQPMRKGPQNTTARRSAAGRTGP